MRIALQVIDEAIMYMRKKYEELKAISQTKITWSLRNFSPVNN